MNTPSCPQLVKDEFQESQVEIEDKIPDGDNADDDQLILSPLQNPDEEEIVPTQFQMQCPDEEIEQDKERDNDDVASDYDAEEFINDALRYDWDVDRNSLEENEELNFSSVSSWIDEQKVFNV